jgi:hypothetical protein
MRHPPAAMTPRDDPLAGGAGMDKGAEGVKKSGSEESPLAVLHRCAVIASPQFGSNRYQLIGAIFCQ